MTAIQTLGRPPAPDWLRSRVYAGDLLIVHAAPPALRLVEHFDAELRAAFAPHAPTGAQFSLDGDAWRAIARRLRDESRQGARARALMGELFAHFGLDPARTAADVVNLRSQPHADAPAADPRHTLAAHRDTWASNVYQQVNWWLPVYPVTTGRTIAIFPGYWSRAIANDSADWDLEAIRRERRTARAEGRAPVIRNTPEVTAALDPGEAMPVVVEPGDVLIFSGAHLHASVLNASGATRFSLEMRSVDLADAAAGIGAPNVDGAAPHAGWHWFRRLDTGRRVQAPGAAVADGAGRESAAGA